jgi:hypothetical protein
MLAIASNIPRFSFLPLQARLQAGHVTLRVEDKDFVLKLGQNVFVTSSAKFTHCGQL